MVLKGLKQSEEARRKISLILIGNKRRLGKKHSEETKLKISKIKQGTVPWNKGKTNIYSEETKRKISLGAIGRSSWNKGLKNIYSKETLNKNRLAHLGRPNKHKGENNPKISLDKHWNWKGGISFEPYPITFNNEFKKLIRQRDNFTCIKCNLFEEDVKKLYKQVLHVHHIDYNKLLTIPENCCALCIRCNVEVNNNRTHWTKFFQSLLSERYGYKYSEEGEIILQTPSFIKSGKDFNYLGERK